MSRPRTVRVVPWVLPAVLLAAGARASSGADEVSFVAEVDAKKIGALDVVQLTLTLTGPSIPLKEEVAPPPLQNLRIVGGPSVSTQVSIMNGAMTQSRAITWVLQPVAAGRAEIGAAKARLEGGDKTTSPIVLDVVPGSTRPKARPRSDARNPFGEDDPFEAVFGRRRAQGPPPKLSVEGVPSRTKLHVGEPLVLTYYLVAQTAVDDLQLVDAPQYPGFWVEELEKQEGNPAGEPATVEGVPVRRVAFLRRLLFPAKAGTLTIPAATFRLRLPRQGFFDTGGEVERTTKALTITVDPLPEAPGFAGAVGTFKAEVSLSRDSVTLGDAVNLRFRLEGRGNLKWIDKGPEIKVAGAKVYPPQVTTNVKAGPDGFEGAKTWEFVVVPETSGSLEIPALSFTYFQSDTGNIASVTTPPRILTVEGPAVQGSTSTPRAAAGSGLALRSDLDPPAARLPHPSPRTLAVGLGGAVVLHGLLAALAAWADRRRLAGGRHAPRRSVRHALADLSRARRGDHSKEAAAALIQKALHDVFGPVDESRPPEGERERRAWDVLQEVEFLRYAPQLGDYSEKIDQAARRAEDVIRRWA